MHLPPPFLLPLLLAISSSAPSAAAANKPRDAILLSQVESLTLRGGKQTAHRRVPAIPQLTCVSARALCAKYAIDVMRCENKGAAYDAEDIQWSCTAQLPPEFKLGSTDVICEGYASPDDPYILKGSCGVEYRLVLTDAGDDKWPHLGGGGGGGGGEGSSSAWPVLFWVIFAAVACFILVGMCTSAARPDRAANAVGARYNGGGGGGGGGGNGYDDDGWNDPPPPYTGRRGGGGSGRKESNWSGLRGGSGRNSNWQSNLASGAAGAAAGYWAGSRGRTNNNSSNVPNYGSTWGGGGGPSSSGSSGSSGDSAASTSRHESTGFGSTSRR